jgi:hypothetical protein
MTIKAKFAGHCRVCQSPITVGSEIEWEKGKGSMHVGHEIYEWAVAHLEAEVQQ